MEDRPYYFDRDGKINLLTMEDRLDMYTRSIQEKIPEKDDAEFALEKLQEVLSEMKEFIIEAHSFSLFGESPYWRDYLQLLSKILFLIGKCKFIYEEYEEATKWIIVGAEVSPGYDRQTAIYYDALLHKASLKTKEPCRLSLLENAHSLHPNYEHKYQILIEYTL
ncbi:hypothetical protein [Neobacillus niacini]|uniref:hypothetical protein n=1 Tax=Neobacillus niacini TaxID=86668 RepID=UPI0039832219